IGESDAGLLEHRAIAQDPRAATAAQVGAGVGGIALPRVLHEAGPAIGGFDGGADAVLLAGEVVADVVESVHARHSRRAGYGWRCAGSVADQPRPVRGPLRILPVLLQEADQVGDIAPVAVGQGAVEAAD